MQTRNPPRFISARVLVGLLIPPDLFLVMSLFGTLRIHRHLLSFPSSGLNESVHVDVGVSDYQRYDNWQKLFPYARE